MSLSTPEGSINVDEGDRNPVFAFGASSISTGGGDGPRGGEELREVIADISIELDGVGLRGEMGGASAGSKLRRMVCAGSCTGLGAAGAVGV